MDLGEESGFDLARRLQRETGPPPLTVILVSAYAADDFDDLVTGSPAAGFLSKTDLSADAIRRLLRDAADASRAQGARRPGSGLDATPAPQDTRD